jgi:predicted metal-binding protein
MDIARLEEGLRALPLCQYDFIDTSELVFSERIRAVCEQECPMYGKSWACPPGVGPVEECRARCLGFSEALVITTVTEVRDIADLEETLATREPHEEVTRQVRDLLRQEAAEVLVLSTEACAVCERCAWLDGEPCRHPERMFPCVESYGVVATDLAERYGIEFYGGNIVTWFSVLLFR